MYADTCNVEIVNIFQKNKMFVAVFCCIICGLILSFAHLIILPVQE